MPAIPFRFVVALLVASPLLAACSSDFDPGDLTDKLDFFHLNEKKKLPGERKELFPGGVPGVTQGIPPDLVKGYQPPATAAATEELPEQKAEPEKPKPKPRVVHRTPPKQKPAEVKVTPQKPQQAAQPQQPQQAQQQPQTQPQQQQNGTQTPWPAPQTQSSPWPAAPAPNTFQR
jgi:hypothetical protein